MKRLALLLALAFLAAPLRADDTTPGPPVTDPAAVARHYHEVVAEPQYAEVDDSQINYRVEDWLSRWFQRMGAEFGDFKYASRMPAFESLLMSLLVVFAIAVLLYVMVRLTRRRHRVDAEPELAARGEVLERVPESYDREIEEAVRARDWHSAWLAAWRQFLSRLERRRLVEPDRSRTNREYLAQLEKKSLSASAFALVTSVVNAYDTVIYGRKTLGEPEWSRFRGQLGEAGLLLHLHEKAEPPTRSAR